MLPSNTLHSRVLRSKLASQKAAFHFHRATIYPPQLFPPVPPHNPNPPPDSLAYLESLLAYFILTTEAASKDSNGVDPVLNALLGHVDFISEERLATIVTGIETERELAE